MKPADTELSVLYKMYTLVSSHYNNKMTYRYGPTHWLSVSSVQECRDLSQGQLGVIETM